MLEGRLALLNHLAPEMTQFHSIQLDLAVLRVPDSYGVLNACGQLQRLIAGEAQPNTCVRDIARLSPLVIPPCVRPSLRHCLLQTRNERHPHSFAGRQRIRQKTIAIAATSCSLL